MLSDKKHSLIVSSCRVWSEYLNMSDDTSMSLVRYILWRCKWISAHCQKLCDINFLLAPCSRVVVVFGVVVVVCDANNQSDRRPTWSHEEKSHWFLASHLHLCATREKMVAHNRRAALRIEYHSIWRIFLISFNPGGFEWRLFISPASKIDRVREREWYLCLLSRLEFCADWPTQKSVKFNMYSFRRQPTKPRPKSRPFRQRRFEILRALSL